MLLQLLPLPAIFCGLAAAADSAAGGIPALNGNLGLTGAGYGDAYGGTIKDGVYGVGGRAGGQLGLSGLLGMGSGRRKRQDFGFVPFASLGVAPPAAPAPAVTTAAPGRKKRQSSASASAQASGNGANANAIASAISGGKAPKATTAGPASRKKRQANPFAFANAAASANGTNALASASAGVAPKAPAATTAAPAARKKRQDFGFVPFASLNVPGGPGPAPAATTAAPAPAQTTVPPC